MEAARITVGARAGQGELECALVAGASAIVSVAARSPLKLVVARERGACARVHVATFGGGLLAGDRIDLDVAVGVGAALVVGSSAPAKVYRAEAGATGTARLRARVAAGALLAWTPSPVTCFANANYLQSQEFSLDDGASLLFVDTLASGRPARGERWAFDACELQTRVSRAGVLALHDGLRLARGAVPVPDRFGRFDALATVLFSGPRLTDAAREALARVAAVPLARRAPLVATAAARPDGVLVRAAAESVEALERFVRELVAAPLAAMSGDAPWHGPW